MARIHLTRRLPTSFEAARVAVSSVLTDLAERGAELDTEILGFLVGRDVTLTVDDVVSVDRPLEVSVIVVRISDAEHPHAFPSFVGEFELVATGECDVELALEGDYHPPAGAAGAAIDMMGLHTVAEKAMRGFFDEIVRRVEKAAQSSDALRGVPI